MTARREPARRRSNAELTTLTTRSSWIGSTRSKGALLIALAACSSVDVVEIIEKKRIKLTLLEVTTTGEHDPEPPYAFGKIHVKYRLGGDGLTPKAVEQAINLSQEKYCSVAATVRGVAQITTEYEIVPANEIT